jgi:predicted PurR-regulated permease PerM
MVVVIVALVLQFSAILFPFVVASIVAYVLEPMVGRVAKRGLPRWVSVIVVYLVFGFSVWGFGYYLFPKLAHEGEKGIRKLQVLMRDAPTLFEDARDRIQNLVGQSETSPDDAVTHDTWGGLSDPTASRFGLGPNLANLPLFENLPEVPVLPQVELPTGQDDSSVADVLAQARGETSPLGGSSLESRIGSQRAANLLVEELGEGRFGIRLADSTFEIEQGRKGTIRIAPKPSYEEASPLADLQDQLAAAAIDGLEAAGRKVLETVLALVQSILQGLMGAMIGVVLVFMVAAFMLMSADGMRAFFKSLVPPKWHGEYRELLQMLDQGLAGVVRGQLLICLVNGVLSFIGFWIFIPEYAVVLAIFAAVMSIVPIFGTIISSVPAVLVGLTDGWGTALAVLGWILGIHFIEANFLNPKIIGTAAHIHPVIVVFVLIAGEHAYGLPGVILSVPAISLLQVFYRFTYHRIRPYLWGERA